MTDAVKANIDRFSSAVSRLREWTFTFSFGLAPDTNENAATGVSLINILGLPFALDASARRMSGIGLTGDIGGEWSPLLSDNLKARIGVDAYRLDYGGAQFDDMTVTSYAGPQLLFADWDISALVTGFQRWYGNRPFLNGGGGRLAADIGITSDWLIGVSLGGQRPVLSHQFRPKRAAPFLPGPCQLCDFPLQPVPASGRLQPTGRGREPLFLFRLVARRGLQSRPFLSDFPADFQPSQPTSPITMRRWRGFGATRADRTLMLNFSLLNRRFEYRGFTPKFSYSFTNQQSNIALYRYSRSQFQIGLTTQF